MSVAHKLTHPIKHPLALAVAKVSIAVSGCYGALYTGSALAQEEVNTHKPMLEEVVVTAQRREQSLQDVPIAVSTVSALDLKEAGTETIVELQKSSPNTTLQTSRGTNSTLTAFIRGVGQADPLWGFEPGVGLYVDDVYYARPQSGVLDIIDVERVEILRGPQGTLYGKNTIGGAVKYVTRRMTGDMGFTANAAIGTYGQRDIKLSGQLPVMGQELIVGGAVAVLQRDGYGKFLLSGKDNYNKDIVAARVNVEYSPTADWFFRLSIDDTQDDSNAKGGYRLRESLLTNEQPLSDVFDTLADMDTRNSVESSGVSLTAEWDIADDWRFKSVTAYREGRTDTNIDFDNTSIASVHVPAIYDDDQFTQELQFTYTGNQLNVVGGFYYFKGNAAGAFDVLLNQTDTDADSDGVIDNFSVLTAGSVDTDSYSLYAHGTYDLTDVLALTLGARYTLDKKDATVYKEQLFVSSRSARLGGADVSSFLVLSDYSNDDDWSRFSPRISLDYAYTNDILLYAAYSAGFKSGGFDMRGDQSSNPNTVNGYDPENVDTYEVGMKSELWENRLRLNLAVFYSDYTDVQVTVQESANGGTNFVSSVLNAGEAEITGLEAEAVLQITNNLNATFALGYIDADFTKVETLTANGIEDLSDIWAFSNTPELSAFAKLNYQRELGTLGALSFNTSLAYRDETRVGVTEAVIDEGSYSLWDASLVWYSPDETWTVGLHGKNLTDKEYRIAGYNFPATVDTSGAVKPGLGGEDVVVGYYGAPRTISLAVGYNF